MASISTSVQCQLNCFTNCCHSGQSFSSYSFIVAQQRCPRKRWYFRPREHGPRSPSSGGHQQFDENGGTSPSGRIKSQLLHTLRILDLTQDWAHSQGPWPVGPGSLLQNVCWPVLRSLDKSQLLFPQWPLGKKNPWLIMTGIEKWSRGTWVVSNYESKLVFIKIVHPKIQHLRTWKLSWTEVATRSWWAKCLISSHSSTSVATSTWFLESCSCFSFSTKLWWSCCRNSRSSDWSFSKLVKIPREPHNGFPRALALFLSVIRMKNPTQTVLYPTFKLTFVLQDLE